MIMEEPNFSKFKIAPYLELDNYKAPADINSAASPVLDPLAACPSSRLSRSIRSVL